jgi:signal transduction histidine kinase
VETDAGEAELLAAVAREAADLLGAEEVAIIRRPEEGSGTCVPVGLGAGAWGAVCARARPESPLPPDTHHRLTEVARLVSVLLGGDVVAAGLRRVAREQGIANRLARRAAADVSTPEILAAIVDEISDALGVPEVTLGRYQPDGTVVVLASTGPAFPTGTIWRGEAEPGSALRAPIRIGGDVWGVLHVPVAGDESASPGAGERLEGLADLVSDVIANAQARDDLQRLAREQAALRAVATLIAEQAPPQAVFDAVAIEVSRVLDVARIDVSSYNSDGSATVLATTRDPSLGPIGTRWALDGPSALATILRTGAPARIDNLADMSGTIAALHRDLGYGTVAGAPIRIGGSVWGAVVAVAVGPEQPLPVGTEHRIADFTQLLASALASVQAWSDLAASRARIVVAADEERRRVVRDLHDGAQQSLVHTVVTLKLARRAIAEGRPDAAARVEAALEHAQTATQELSTLAHGILPAALTTGGLRAGVSELISRMPIPVSVEVPAERLPGSVEATAYFVVAEALTNVTKHAQAQHAAVRVAVDRRILRVEVGDDGVGGVRADGSGLLGLRDRLGALDGGIRFDDPADGGTLLTAWIPIPSR